MYFQTYHYLKMKLLFFLSFIILASCTQDPPPIIYGCMDKNSSYYNPAATVDDGNCKYGGRIAICRTTNGNTGDKLQFWLDSANGNKLILSAEAFYNGYTNEADPCKSKAPNFFIPLGDWKYQLRLKRENGDSIDLTTLKTVHVYNKYCEKVTI
jgi:hypothetical protein